MKAKQDFLSLMIRHVWAKVVAFCDMTAEYVDDYLSGHKYDLQSKQVFDKQKQR